jgi:hypothetical protein
VLTKHLGVRFLYEEEDTTRIAGQTGSAEVSLTIDALAALPAE